MRFLGQSVLITGAAIHTGYGIAERFIQEGARTVINDLHGEDVKAATGRLKSKYPEAEILEAPGDITDPNDVKRIFNAVEQKLGTLHVLVNNACDQGLGYDFLNMPYGRFKQVIDVNVNGLFLVSQYAARMMRQSQGGTIVHIGSNASKHALRNRSAYGASKGAVDALTKAMALDLAEYGIRVNTVVPGYVRTTRWDGLTENEVEQRRRNIPLGKELLSEDVANAVLFFAGEESRLITGARLVVDGGSSSQLVPKNCELQIITNTDIDEER
ncbi:SDR family NAD(P)-dependent oxidoreductase [Paenibacillus sedimenti]|uniref:SDR family oxidoreductase n=1 Tax=Paenibacillus sedimenti TaxID=2770274 RepID=A0A926KL52_9BACL|nr:SDR family oxidoreductase [Paenibacillus sedimenti]MBD0379804.1 SDR family oxidoreductase [Paenibacillus sedimenti]